MKTVIESFKSPSLAGFFVTIFDRAYFHTSLAYFAHGPLLFGGPLKKKFPPRFGEPIHPCLCLISFFLNSLEIF
jgi:hypothetical protein